MKPKLFYSCIYKCKYNVNTKYIFVFLTKITPVLKGQAKLYDRLYMPI